MITATMEMADDILKLYKFVVEEVNKTDIKLGWNCEVYPDMEFIKSAIACGDMKVITDNSEVIAAAVVNYNVNKEYDDIDWQIKAPKDEISKISTIHALAVSPLHRGKKLSDTFLQELEEYCRENNDIAIHLDVIDTNIPAYKLYMRNGYTEVACIKMFYEVVGTREFWMLEKVL